MAKVITGAALLPQNYILIYADGCCLGNPGPGGWAATVRKVNGSEVAPKQILAGCEPGVTTNNRMELIAAISAIEALDPDDQTPVIIRTDSEYVVKGMNEWHLNWINNGWRNSSKKAVLNRDLWEHLIALSAKRDITWQWVRGHSGEPYNEEVDTLAHNQAEMAARIAA